MNRLRVLLVRHGESTNNVLTEVGYDFFLANRTPDPDLTTLGEGQALALANYLGKRSNTLFESFDDVYVSPMKRTLATAFPVAIALGARPRVWTDVHEVGGIHLGGTGLGGLTRSAMRDAYPFYEIPEEVTENGWYALSSEETRDQALARIRDDVAVRLKSWAKDCGTSKVDRTIALVVHGYFINILLQVLTDRHDVTFHSYNTALYLLDIYQNGRVRLVLENNIEHLKQEK